MAIGTPTCSRSTHEQTTKSGATSIHGHSLICKNLTVGSASTPIVLATLRYGAARAAGGLLEGPPQPAQEPKGGAGATAPPPALRRGGPFEGNAAS